MCQFTQDNWKELIGFLIAGFGIWKYLDTRKNELVWKRTEFLFEQARLLDSGYSILDMAPRRQFLISNSLIPINLRNLRF
ncbi:MAG: hypothetical protein ACE5HX_15680 [bacterium]